MGLSDLERSRERLPDQPRVSLARNLQRSAQRSLWIVRVPPLRSLAEHVHGGGNLALRVVRLGDFIAKHGRARATASLAVRSTIRGAPRRADAAEERAHAVHEFVLQPAHGF